jgi:Zn-finger nucleic acid-binding protein
MNCPICREISLRSTDFQGVSIDECPSCGGLWFDRDELRKSQGLADPDLNWMDFELWADQNQFQKHQSPHQCPRCALPLTILQYGSTDVNIECCDSCRGIWLEKGKFEKLLSALETEVNNKSLGSMFSEALREARELVSGKKSFVAEWKDFTTVLRLLEYRFLANYPGLHDTLTVAQKTNPIK